MERGLTTRLAVRNVASAVVVVLAFGLGGCSCAPLRVAAIVDFPLVEPEEMRNIRQLMAAPRELEPAAPVDRETIDESTLELCDPIDPARCLLPFPNDFYTVPRDGSETGRRIAFDRAAMPTNRKGQPIAPESWNENDGFSPGPLIITLVPGLDLGVTGAPTMLDFARSTTADSPIQLIEVGPSPRRVPVWAELDAQATSASERALLIRPTANLIETKRYVVVLQGLKDAAGQTIAPSRAFRIYRSGECGEKPAICSALAKRQAHFEEIFATTTAMGVARDDLYLAWDFTVASSTTQSERLLKMRDDAFGQLGKQAPSAGRTCHVDSSGHVARRVWGTLRVPSYLEGDGGPGSRLELGADGLPKRNGKRKVYYSCIIPHQAFAEPARLALYGHGTLGNIEEIMAGDVQAMAAEHNIVFCATNWSGQATGDYFQAYKSLADASDFPSLVDRAHQGILNMLFLGRWMMLPDGLAKKKDFKRDDGTSLVDLGKGLVFDGNSQGALLGGTATAVALDWSRAVLGVGGMNYSLILDRSKSFASDPLGIDGLDSLKETHEKAYPDAVDQQLVLALMQMLWDRVDLNGHAAALRDGRYCDDCDPKAVLLHVALNDQSVPNVSSATLARTLELKARQPVLGPTVLAVASPFKDFAAAGTDENSILVVWDAGGPPTPIDNTIPGGGDNPHDKIRDDPQARRQKAAFFDGRFADVCDVNEPCTTQELQERSQMQSRALDVTCQCPCGSNLSNGPSTDAHDPKERP